jgi:hypothetical protein
VREVKEFFTNMFELWRYGNFVVDNSGLLVVCGDQIQRFKNRAVPRRRPRRFSHELGMGVLRAHSSKHVSL